MSGVAEQIAQLSDDVKKALKAEGAQAERERVLGLWKGMLSDAEDHTAFAELVELGASVEEGVTIYKKRRLSQLTASAPETTGGSVETIATKTDLTALPVEERAKQEWEKDAKLRDEFGSLATYTAWKVAEESGQAMIFAKK